VNKQNFIELCQGDFGRKTAYVDVEVVDASNVVAVLGEGVSVLNKNRALMDYLYRYYKGDQPINYKEKLVRPEINNKVCENHSLEIVRFKTGQTFGEPIQYVGKKKKANDEINTAIDLLNDYMDDAHADARNITLGIYQKSMGTAYKAIQKNLDWTADSGLPPFNIYIPDPKNVGIVYSSSTGKELLSFQQLKDINGNQYFMCYSRDTWYKIQNGAIVESGVNGFKGIPIIEYPNNSDKLSDIEIGITLLDAINNVQSQRIDGIEQFVQALMKFKNCDIDENTFLDMVKLGAVSVKDSGDGKQADVEMMSSELNQSHTQISKDDLYSTLLIIEGMPDRQSNTGGDTGQAVYLRNGWDFAEQRAKIDEPFTKESESKAAQIILNVIAETSKDINLSVRDFEIRISRGSTDNMLVKAQALDYLFKNKIHPLIALITCGMFPDPQKVYEMSLPYLGSLYPELVQGDEGQQQIDKAQQLLANAPTDGEVVADGNE